MQRFDFPENTLYYIKILQLPYLIFKYFRYTWNNLPAVTAIAILTYLKKSRNQACIDRIVDIHGITEK